LAVSHCIKYHDTVDLLASKDNNGELAIAAREYIKYRDTVTALDDAVAQNAICRKRGLRLVEFTKGL